jgi:protein tyrosine/serine phosphatase
MRVNRKISRAVAGVTASVLALAVMAVAQSARRDASSKTRIDNFGCINEKFYRGAQPRPGDYKDLAAMGVKTIIDLQQDGERDEQEMVEAAGMKFHRIGMSDSSWPSPEKAAQFIKLVNDPENQPVFIHCHGGRHRAGIMTAIYRMSHDGWDADQAYQEMKQYGFERGFGHSSLKDYIYDYYSRLDKKAKDVVVKTDK